jgi:hypothetical protein
LPDASARIRAIRRIGGELASREPIVAMSRGKSLPSGLKSPYSNAIAREWQRFDTKGFLDYAATQWNLSDLLQGLEPALGTDAERVYEIAKNRSPVNLGVFGTLERFAFRVVASRDRQRALALLESVPEGPRKIDLRGAIAEVFGQTQPEEALAWVRSLNPPAPDAEAAVIAQVAARDIDRGLRLLADFKPAPDNPTSVAEGLPTAMSIANQIGLLAGLDSRRSEIADRLCVHGKEPLAAAILRRLMTTWAGSDPASALDWVFANEARLDRALAKSIVAQAASRDPRTAVEFLDHATPMMRSALIEEVGLPLARQDPTRATKWIEQFQGEPGYESMAARVISESARTDPSGAGRMLSAAPNSVQDRAAGSVAASWARKDLNSAAEWVGGLSSSAARSNATMAVAAVWVARDPAAAQVWATTLPPGEARDRALSTILTQIVQSGSSIDRKLVNAFGSDILLQNQIMAAAASVAKRDPDRAQTLLEKWVTDPALKRKGQEIIEDVRK